MKHEESDSDHSFWFVVFSNYALMIKNTIQSYGIVSKFFHWVMAFFLFVNLAIGLYMTRIDESPIQILLINFHKSLGITLLILIILRMIWKFINIQPYSLLSSKILNMMVKAFHYFFYIVLLTIPISGWTYSLALGYPVSFFGLFSLPNFISENKSLSEIILFIHNISAYILILLIIVHIFSAIYHHFVLKNQTLNRMWFKELNE